MPSKDKEVLRLANKRYRESAHGKARRKAYKSTWDKSEEGKVMKAESGRTYRRTAAYKATVAPKMQSRRAKRLAWLRGVKSKLACSGCGFDRHPAALQFHHVGDDKVGSVTALLLTGNVSLEVVKAEMAKCIVLCANCHAILHDEEQESVRALRTRGSLQIQGEDGHSLNQIVSAGKRQEHSNSGATHGEQYVDDQHDNKRGHSPLCQLQRVH